MEGHLPPTWRKVPLSDVIHVAKGRRPDGLGPESELRTVPYINIAGFERGAVAEYAPEQGMKRINPDQTLLVWDGARAGLVGRTDISGYAGSTLGIISALVVDPGYLYYFLQSKFVTLNSATKGAGIPHIDPVVLNGLEFPLAPLADQRAIVRQLDEGLAHLRTAVKEVEGARRDAARAWAAGLAAAMRGDLTAIYRDRAPAVEDGAALRDRICRSRKEASIATVPNTETLTELPKSWIWSSLGTCFDIVVGGTPSRRQPEYWGGEVPWVSSGEVRFNRIANTREAITSEGLAHSSTKLNPPGSVLLGMIGQGKTLGQVAILDVEAATNQNCAAIRVSETDIPPEYVFYWMWSRYDATREAGVGNSQPALNRTLIHAMPLPLPPLDEMRVIVSLLDSARSQADQLEVAVKHLIPDIDRQRSSLLESAFSGTLVRPVSEPGAVDDLIKKISLAKIAIKLKPRTERISRRPRSVSKNIEDILRSEGGWLSAPELFHRAGVVDECPTEIVEARFRELMLLERADKIDTEAVLDDDGRKITDRIRLK
jgi:type I restriction enzyme S subunit